MMPVEISVKDVRLELLRVAGTGEVGEGDAVTLVLGTMFHEVFADLV
jgi:DNA segregation ATPase FtsK/SpoIIIE, S-DNA-T family